MENLIFSLNATVPIFFMMILGFVFRNLRWDAESDLAHWVGDIAAHRLVAVGGQLVRWHQQQAVNLAANLAEYFTEESPSIARRADVADFCRAVAALPDELARLEARIASLEAPCRVTLALTRPTR